MPMLSFFDRSETEEFTLVAETSSRLLLATNARLRSADC